MSEFKSGIYKITINSYYIYIGQSVDIMSRWNGHLNELKQNKKSYNIKFQNIYNKYPDTIKFEIIELCDVDKLDEREMYWINYYRSFNTKHGLNMSIGGDCGWRKYRTKEEAEVARKQYYQDNKEHIKQQSKQYRQDNKEHIKQQSKQYRQDNKEHIKQYYKQYRQDNKEHIKQYYNQWYQNIKKQKGVLSNKEKFEIRYNLSRQLNDDEWNLWINNPKINGNCYCKFYAIKYLQSLPNLTFTIPPKK